LPKKVYTSGSNKYTLIDDSGNFIITSGSPSSSYTLSLLNQAYDLSTYPTETAFYVPRFIVRAELSTVAPNFVVNVGSNNYTIVTDTLWLSNTFKVTGTGKLTFIVKQNISSKTFDTNWPITASTNPVPIRINSSGIIGNVNPNESKMVIYVQTITTKGSPITLAFGSGSYYFSIFAENLKYTLDSITVHGAIGTNASGEAITLSTSNNSSAILLFAPNATVTLKSSSSAYNGAIICNKLTMDNPNAAVSPTINFDPVINGFIIPGVIDVGGLVSPPSITFIKSATQE
jgi:hypothetical protein